MFDQVVRKALFEEMFSFGFLGFPLLRLLLLIQGGDIYVAVVFVSLSCCAWRANSSRKRGGSLNSLSILRWKSGIEGSERTNLSISASAPGSV